MNAQIFYLVTQALSFAFTSTLNSNCHALILFTVSALESFAASIPVKHREILPKCIPSKIQRIIHARLNGVVYYFDTERERVCFYVSISVSPFISHKYCLLCGQNVSSYDREGSRVT